VIYERDALEILHTEMDSGSVFNRREFRDFAPVHYVIDGTPVFRQLHEYADLMPSDCIVFLDQNTYTISNGAPDRSVFLSVLFKPCATPVQSIQMATKEISA